MKLPSILMLSAALLCGQQKLAPVDESGYRALLKSNLGHVTLVDFFARVAFAALSKHFR